MGRKLNPRRQVLAVMAEMKRTLADTVKTWSVESRVWTFATETRRVDPKNYPGRTVGEDGLVAVEFSANSTRKRRADEYPENSAGYWAGLFNEMERLEKQAKQVKNLARQHYFAIKHPDEYAPCGCRRLLPNHFGACLDALEGPVAAA